MANKLPETVKPDAKPRTHGLTLNQVDDFNRTFKALDALTRLLNESGEYGTVGEILFPLIMDLEETSRALNPELYRGDK